MIKHFLSSLSFLTYILYQRFQKIANFYCYIPSKTWWGLCFTTTLTLLNSHKALTTSTYSWSACRRRASSLYASYDTSLYLAYQVGRYHLTRFNGNKQLAGSIGLEPIAYRLTAGCSTIELTTQINKAHFDKCERALPTELPISWDGVGLEPTTSVLEGQYL